MCEGGGGDCSGGGGDCSDDCSGDCSGGGTCCGDCRACCASCWHDLYVCDVWAWKVITNAGKTAAPKPKPIIITRAPPPVKLTRI